MGYEFNFSSVLAYAHFFAQGAWTTLVLTFWATLAGFLLGTLCAVGRTSGPKPVRMLVSAYVEVIRNTPMLIQAYFLIFGLASIGVRLPIMVGAVLTMVVNVGSYSTEVMRAGIESIKRGQLEAAATLGLSKWQVFLHVILRPAMERVYPSLASLYVLLMLGSSV